MKGRLGYAEAVRTSPISYWHLLCTIFYSIEPVEAECFHGYSSPR